MPTYTFLATQRIVLEAETAIQADSLQDAFAEFARRSQTMGGLSWGSGPDGDQASCVLRAIDKDGERIPGFADPIGPGEGISWWGLSGAFDVDDLPDELRALKG